VVFITPTVTLHYKQTYVRSCHIIEISLSNNASYHTVNQHTFFSSST